MTVETRIFFFLPIISVLKLGIILCKYEKTHFLDLLVLLIFNLKKKLIHYLGTNLLNWC
jgi:hypothetical protein